MRELSAVIVLREVRVAVLVLAVVRGSAGFCAGFALGDWTVDGLGPYLV